MQSVHCRLATLLNKLHQFSKLLQSIILCYNFNSVDVEELNHMKDYMKLRHKHMGRATLPPFAGKETQKQSTTLSVLDLEGAFSVKYLLTHF